jgi:hypothetical protein
MFRADLAERSQDLLKRHTIRLMMIDHHRCFTDSLAYRINSEDLDLKVIGTADDAETGMRMILESKPEMVVNEPEGLRSY